MEEQIMGIPIESLLENNNGQTSNNSLQNTTQSQLSESVKEKLALCRLQYETPQKCIISFAPNQLSYYLKCYGKSQMILTEKVPSLNIVRMTFGDQTAEAILSAHIYNVANFMGKKPTVDQVNSVATAILNSMYHYKVTEIMLCFQLMMEGEFKNERGENILKMYGDFDGSAILDCFHMFRNYRANIIDRDIKEKADIERERMCRDCVPMPDSVREFIHGLSKKFDINHNR